MNKKVLFLAVLLLAMVSGLRSQNVITIEGDQSATTSNAPISTLYNYSYAQMIYSGDEVGGECDIYGIGFHAQNETSRNRYVQIWLAPYSGSLSTWQPVVGNGAKLVYSGLYTTGSNDWSNVTFTSPFHHNAGEGVLVIVNDVTGTWPGTTYFYANTSDTAIYVRQDSEHYVPYLVTSELSSSKTIRPDVKFYTSGPASIDYATVTAPFTEDFEGTPRKIDSLWRSVNDYNAYWMMEDAGSAETELIGTNSTRFAKFFRFNYQHCVGSLISPLVQTNEVMLRLSFSYECVNFGVDNDTLMVYYRTSTDGDWQLLMNTDGANSTWTNVTFDIPSSSAQVKFEARTHYGYGTAIDNVSFQALPLSVSINSHDNAAMGTPFTLTAVGPEEATYNWTFPGANPSSATGKTVTTTWNTEGVYTVAVVATFASQTATATKQVTVLDCSTITEFPYEESFETNGLGCWTTIDADGDGYDWAYFSPSDASCAHTGSVSIRSTSYQDGYGLNPDNWIISPKFHLPSLSAQISWWERAHSSSWTHEHYGLYISTTGTNPENFILLWEGEPQSGASWNQRTMLLNPYCGQEVYIAFRHFDTYNQFALLLDDIVVDGTVGVEEHENVQVSVWPNPTTGLVNISSTEPVKTVEVYNVQGALVKTLSGESTLDLRNQPVGVYMVRVTTESTTSVQRVVLR